MKSVISGMLTVAMVLFLAASYTSCSPKSGCPAYESAKVQTNRKGELPTKRGKSSLFPKDMRKKTGRK